mmetsp:Transcript_106793/g.267706  ORF Transcript_106793/g.267706 Transcript_106793/m.267706 type:complete len:221 (+) Transcript_106793:1288-1950(+)
MRRSRRPRRPPRTRARAVSGPLCRAARESAPNTATFPSRSISPCAMLFLSALGMTSTPTMATELGATCVHSLSTQAEEAWRISRSVGRKHRRHQRRLQLQWRTFRSGTCSSRLRSSAPPVAAITSMTSSSRSLMTMTRRLAQLASGCGHNSICWSWTSPRLTRAPSPRTAATNPCAASLSTLVCTGSPQRIGTASGIACRSPRGRCALTSAHRRLSRRKA